MAKPEGTPPFSLTAFIEQTAQMLRNAVKAPSKKKRTIRKEDHLSNTNKIRQIARLLREEAGKISPKKRKKKRP